jgi:glycosyltransferase involved in cell wall biosynthesis
LKILLLTSEFAPRQGGIGTYAREIAGAASALGAHVTVVAPDYAQDTTAEDQAMPFAVRRFRGGLHSSRDLPAKIMLTRREIAADRFDVVHAADWPFFIPVALARGLTKARLLMTVHGTEINETQTTFKRAAIRATGVFGSRTEVIANSAYTKGLFHEKFAVDAQVRAILLGVAPFWFGQAGARAATRQSHGIADDRIVMVTVARITRRKGHHLALAALKGLPDDLRKRVTWLVIGPPGEKDYVDELKGMIAAADCDVRLLGPLADAQIRDIYAAADMFCLTAVPEASGRVEGFGLVYLEAAACGLPSVATAMGGAPEAVLDRQTGLTVAPTVAAVTQAIMDLAQHNETRATYGAGALVHARNLSWQRCATETYGLARSSADIENPVMATVAV